MSEWKAKVDEGGGVAEIELSGQFEELTADVISHTAFGASYREGKRVFLAQRELLFLAFSTVFNVQIRAFRCLTTCFFFHFVAWFKPTQDYNLYI